MIGKLKALRTLTLSNNLITSLPGRNPEGLAFGLTYCDTEGFSGIGGCIQLSELWLKGDESPFRFHWTDSYPGNPIKRIPPEIAQLGNLRVLLLP